MAGLPVVNQGSSDGACKSVMRAVAMRSRLPGILLAVVAGIPLMPLDASAQPSPKVYRIGVLETSPPDLRSPGQMAFYEELRKRGYVEGQNPKRRAPQRKPSA